ncbi:hypothetical protein PATA110616_19375 [Paenibacillus tarimensis]
MYSNSKRVHKKLPNFRKENGGTTLGELISRLVLDETPERS